MPAHKRSLPDNLHEEDSLQNQTKHSQVEREADEEERGVRPQNEDLKQGGEEEAEDSEGSPSASSSEQKPEYIFVELQEVRKDVQCPICLGIIKKTRTVMECLHRFCRECIDKSMRTGNNECPACRTHCASRRSLRDDPKFDALIAALFPNIDKYEEEELAFHEEEKNRNKQIQASIAQIFQRQSEALVKRRTLGKDTGGLMTRSHQNLRNVLPRRRRGSRGTEIHASEYNEDENNGGRDSSSNDERCTEIRQRRCKRRIGPRSAQPSPSATANLEGGYTGNDSETNKESRGISPGIVWSPEILAWGGGGARSHTRHGSNSGGNSKTSQSSRISRLVDYYKNYNETHKENETNKEVDVFFVLISLDEQNAPPMEKPFHSCREDVSVKSLRDYVARHASLEPEEVEILVDENSALYSVSGGGIKPVSAVDQSNGFPALGEETLAEVKARFCVTCRYPMVLAYRRKETTS